MLIVLFLIIAPLVILSPLFADQCCKHFQQKKIMRMLKEGGLKEPMTPPEFIKRWELLLKEGGLKERITPSEFTRRWDLLQEEAKRLEERELDLKAEVQCRAELLVAEELEELRAGTRELLQAEATLDDKVADQLEARLLALDGEVRSVNHIGTEQKLFKVCGDPDRLEANVSFLLNEQERPFSQVSIEYHNDEPYASGRRGMTSGVLMGSRQAILQQVRFMGRHGYRWADVIVSFDDVLSEDYQIKICPSCKDSH
jgi:hypothetical protein